MAVTNLNKPILDTPEVQQMAFAPATGVSGTCFEPGGNGDVYYYIQTAATTAQFWLYNSVSDSWQQLANPPTVTGTVASLSYQSNSGGQYAGRTYGAVYLFVGNGSVAYFYRYNRATNTWSTMSVAGIPATFATDCSLVSLDPSRNDFETDYHAGVTRLITTSAAVATNATSISVTALPEALAIGARLRFGTFDITLSAGAVKGATTLAVSPVPGGLASGTALSLSSGYEIVLNGAVTAGATSIAVFPLQRDIESGTVIVVERYVVLTAAAAAAATSITVSPSMYTIDSGATAPYYGQMYMIGHASTVIYRYNCGANAWYTTSANSGNPPIPAIPAATGAGCSIKWMSAYYRDKLYIIRGANTANIYTYDLVANTMATITYYPTTETFTTGSFVVTRSLGNRNGKLLIHKENTGRVYEFCPLTLWLGPKFHQNKLAYGTAVAGARGFTVMSPDGVEFYYVMTSSTTNFARIALLDS